MSGIDGIGKVEDPIENIKYVEGNDTGAEFTTDTPENSTPVDIPDASENDSGERGAFSKTVAALGVGMSLWGTDFDEVYMIWKLYQFVCVE